MNTKYLLVLSLLLVGCNKKEDAPRPGVADIKGSWVGTGTDNSIGFYNISVNITAQTGDQAFGTYDTASSYVTTHGDIRIDLAPGGGNNITALTMTRTSWGAASCAGTASLKRPGYFTSKASDIAYSLTDCTGTDDGGFNLHKP